MTNSVRPELYDASYDPSVKETANAVAALKRKASGRKRNPPEVYKTRLKPPIGRLHKLSCSTWKSEIFPSD